MQVRAQEMSGDTGTPLHLDDKFSRDPVPFRNGAAREAQVMSYLREQPAGSADAIHTFRHAKRLPEGSRLCKAKRFPTVYVMDATIRRMEIGHRIKKARELAGLSQSQLAAATGVSRGLVGNWESHRKKPGRETLSRIASATTVTVDYLLGKEPPDAMTVTTRDPAEISLLRRFRRLAPIQQKNLLQLVDAAVEVRQEIEQETSPTERQLVP